MAKNPKKGWYADPASPGREREWDGSAWTDARRDAPIRFGHFSTGLQVLLILILVGSCAGGSSSQDTPTQTTTTVDNGEVITGVQSLREDVQNLERQVRALRSAKR